MSAPSGDVWYVHRLPDTYWTMVTADIAFNDTCAVRVVHIGASYPEHIWCVPIGKIINVCCPTKDGLNIYILDDNGDARILPGGFLIGTQVDTISMFGAPRNIDVTDTTLTRWYTHGKITENVTFTPNIPKIESNITYYDCVTGSAHNTWLKLAPKHKYAHTWCKTHWPPCKHQIYYENVYDIQAEYINKVPSGRCKLARRTRFLLKYDTQIRMCVQHEIYNEEYGCIPCGPDEVQPVMYHRNPTIVCSKKTDIHSENQQVNSSLSIISVIGVFVILYTCYGVYHTIPLGI